MADLLLRTVMGLSLSLVAFNTDLPPLYISIIPLFFPFLASISLLVFHPLFLSSCLHPPTSLSFSSSHSLIPRDSRGLLFFCFLSIQNQQLRGEDFFFLSRFVSSHFSGTEILFLPFGRLFFGSGLSEDVEIQAVIIYNPSTPLSPSLHPRSTFFFFLKSRLNPAAFC